MNNSNPFVEAMKEVEAEDFVEFAVRAKTIFVGSDIAALDVFPEFVERWKKHGVSVVVSPYVGDGKVHAIERR